MKQFTLLAIGAFAAVLIFIACGPEFQTENTYFRFFSPHVIHNDPYQPFFRAASLFYNGEKFHNINDFDSINTVEWKHFLGDRVTSSDIEHLLYTALPSEIESLSRYLKDSTFSLAPKMKQSSILMNADPGKVKAFLHYLSFAKECEPYTCTTLIWDDPSAARSTNAHTDTTSSRLITQASMALSKESFPFIRERYLFQIIRLLFQENKYYECEEFYNAHVKEITISEAMKYRTMGYYAGALRKIRRYAEANYYYSLVYDNCPVMKVTAYLSFTPKEEADWKETLSMAKNKRERAVLWQMLGIHDDALRGMQEIYKASPESDLLELLLVRDINIAEEKVMPLRNGSDLYRSANETKNEGTDADTMNGDDTYHNTSGSLFTKPSFAFTLKNFPEEDFHFIKAVADAGNTNKPYLWNLGYGYLSFLRGNYTEAKLYLAKAANESGDNQLIHDQIRMISLGIMIEEMQRPSPEFESVIVKELEWLKEKMPDDPDTFEPVPYGGVYQWAMGRLAEKYQSAGDYQKAEPLYYFTDLTVYKSLLPLENILYFMNKPNKSKFDSFILDNYPFSFGDICEYEGIMLFYQGRLREAAIKLEQGALSSDKAKGKKHLLDEASWFANDDSTRTNILPADPFITHIRDDHIRDAHAKQSVKYTKLSFVKKMADLEQKIESKKGDRAKLCFELANGFYNATFYGNSRAFYETYIWMYPSWESNFTGNEAFLRCDLALKYYRMALDNSHDKEFKAQCCYMIAQCLKKNDIAKNWNAPYDSENDESFPQEEYFRILIQHYSNTAYYKEVLKECGYFRDYLHHQ